MPRTIKRPIEIIADYVDTLVFAWAVFVVKLSPIIELIQKIFVKWDIEKGTILMTPEQTVQLINVLKMKREKANLSANEVARRADVDPGTVWRIEQGMIPTPRAESLKAIGKVLGIPSIDLFTIVGWIEGDELPAIGTYLRAKYGDLPTQVLDDIERYFENVSGVRDVHVNEHNRSHSSQSKES